jgi:hypothetical protein
MLSSTTGGFNAARHQDRVKRPTAPREPLNLQPLPPHIIPHVSPPLVGIAVLVRCRLPTRTCGCASTIVCRERGRHRRITGSTTAQMPKTNQRIQRPTVRTVGQSVSHSVSHHVSQLATTLASLLASVSNRPDDREAIGEILSTSRGGCTPRPSHDRKH